MNNRAFQTLKRTFMRALKLPPSYFDKKNPYMKFLFFFHQNMQGEDLRHIYTCVSGDETHDSGLPYYILILKKKMKSNWFFVKIWRGNLRHA